ncbi:hypothetical protein ACFVTC_27250 [Streptomyces sp. NPDC057950]|uniref:hypothetical protein n=1 Tax=Streptomyces sp. NPDC057950 TaxID=3346288 RepID=UPI0036E048EE
MARDLRWVNGHRFAGLLIAIAIGPDDNRLPNGYDPHEDRAYLAGLRGEADDWAQWIGEEAAWPSGAMDALRRWKVPTRHADLRVYAGIIQVGH